MASSLSPLKINMELHSKNRQNLLKSLRQHLSKSSLPLHGFVLLQGGEEQTRYDTDHEELFRYLSFPFKSKFFQFFPFNFSILLTLTLIVDKRVTSRICLELKNLVSMELLYVYFQFLFLFFQFQFFLWFISSQSYYIIGIMIFFFKFMYTCNCFFLLKDVRSGDSILFAPRLPDEYAVWMGKIKPVSHFKVISQWWFFLCIFMLWKHGHWIIDTHSDSLFSEVSVLPSFHVIYMFDGAFTFMHPYFAGTLQGYHCLFYGWDCDCFATKLPRFRETLALSFAWP